MPEPEVSGKIIELHSSFSRWPFWKATTLLELGGWFLFTFKSVWNGASRPQLSNTFWDTMLHPSQETNHVAKLSRWSNLCSSDGHPTLSLHSKRVVSFPWASLFGFKVESWHHDNCTGETESSGGWSFEWEIYPIGGCSTVQPPLLWYSFQTPVTNIRSCFEFQHQLLKFAELGPPWVPPACFDLNLSNHASEPGKNATWTVVEIPWEILVKWVGIPRK